MPQVVQCRGAGGEAPGEINFESPPSPPGKGDGGIGGRSKAKVRVGRRQERQATPSGTTAAKSTGNQNRHAPAGDSGGRSSGQRRRKPTFSFPFPTQEGKTFPQPVEKRVEKHTAWYAVWLMRKPFSRFFAVFRHGSTAAGVWKRPHGARKLHLLPARSEQPGKNTGGYRPHISRSISWYPSAAERLSAASACAQASTAADRTPGSAARATRRYSLT